MNMKKKIIFNKPFINHDAKKNILDVLKKNSFTDGLYQRKCEIFIKKRINSQSIHLTHSCSSALEIAMMLIDLKKDDEVIIPSYTFTSTANCIIMRGAKPVFADVKLNDLNIDPKEIEKKINKKTKAIIIVHYAGIACDMNEILRIKKKYDLFLIEDAAHSFTGKYKNLYLGTIGDFGAFSFHETKNLIAGQGGALSINNKKFIKSAKFILDKGTDRSIIKNKKKYYSWKSVGSEYRAPELTSALLYSQLNNSKGMQKTRKNIWNYYHENLNALQTNLFYTLNKDTIHKESAYHVFPIIFQSKRFRDLFIKYMKAKNVECFFHYYPLHLSSYGKKISKHKLNNTEQVYNGLVRLPLYPGLKKEELSYIIKQIIRFDKKYQYLITNRHDM
jgi:dTDP-4-amino-4,6-dideoxygalactose transaminase